MITNLIKSSIEDGYSAPFISLLRNYGLWARYFGCVGYKTHGSSSESYIIDDESALIIDGAFGHLKQTRPNIFLLVRMYYINGWDEYDILSVIKEKPGRKPKVKKRRNFFAVKSNEQGCLNYLNAQSVRELIIRGEKLIFDYLQERANG